MLTALYVPADRPERFAKAAGAGADLVIVDLEDAVPVAAKASARVDAAEWLDGQQTAVEVRVNSLDSPWGHDDLRALAELGAGLRIRLPKVESADDVRRVLDLLPGARITALLESPLAVERAFEIACSGVAAIGLGESDLAGLLGVDGPEGLAWSRGRLVSASRAAGLGAPMMSVYPHVNDSDGLRDSCLAGRALGFSGRAAIHPAQLPVIVQAFTPTQEELAKAMELLDAVAQAGTADGGVLVLPDGRMVDPAMLNRARELVALAPR
ncbi:HpcH/HpaI aldolase/citrate lyase family protein [Kribbella deserti]|uniref:HpcH/HpaI aldolase/citrate lyase family protein n=1 Tax=Kribbella deserti TaxID=1926257 RepID=A0ABV6QHE7_9ACTN